jgi:hypothetical protein
VSNCGGFLRAFALSDWLMLLSQHSLALRLLFPFPADSADSQQLDRIDRNRIDCSIPNNLPFIGTWQEIPFVDKVNKSKIEMTFAVLLRQGLRVALWGKAQLYSSE